MPTNQIVSFQRNVIESNKAKVKLAKKMEKMGCFTKEEIQEILSKM